MNRTITSTGDPACGLSATDVLAPLVACVWVWMLVGIPAVASANDDALDEPSSANTHQSVSVLDGLPVKPEPDSPILEADDVPWSSTLLEPPSVEETSAKSTPMPDDGSSSPTENWLGLLGRTILVLGAVCLLAYATLKWGVRRLVGPNNDADGLIDVVERKQLGPDSAIVVVDIERRRLVVGDSDAGVQFLTELAEARAPEAGD